MGISRQEVTSKQIGQIYKAANELGMQRVAQYEAEVAEIESSLATAIIKKFNINLKENNDPINLENLNDLAIYLIYYQLMLEDSASAIVFLRFGENQIKKGKQYFSSLVYSVRSGKKVDEVVADLKI